MNRHAASAAIAEILYEALSQPSSCYIEGPVHLQPNDYEQDHHSTNVKAITTASRHHH